MVTHPAPRHAVLPHEASAGEEAASAGAAGCGAIKRCQSVVLGGSVISEASDSFGDS